jgi:hypothetical protein
MGKGGHGFVRWDSILTIGFENMGSKGKPQLVYRGLQWTFDLAQ